MDLNSMITNAMGGASGLNPLLQQLLGSYQQNVSGLALPQFSEADQKMMDTQYNSEVSTQMQLLKKKLMEQLGGLSANAATRGITGSSAHGRAIGQGMSGYQDALAQAMSQASANRLNMQMSLRQAMMGAQSQNLSTLAGLGGGLYGNNMQGFSVMGQNNANQQSRNQQLLGILGGIGSAIPGISQAGGFTEMFKKLF